MKVNICVRSEGMKTEYNILESRINECKIRAHMPVIAEKQTQNGHEERLMALKVFVEHSRGEHEYK